MGKEFKAKIKKNGEIEIQPISEEITYPDGRKDMIIHVPSLTLISDFLNKLKQEGENGKRNL